MVIIRLHIHSYESLTLWGYPFGKFLYCLFWSMYQSFHLNRNSHSLVKKTCFIRRENTNNCLLGSLQLGNGYEDWFMRNKIHMHESHLYMWLCTLLLCKSIYPMGILPILLVKKIIFAQPIYTTLTQPKTYWLDPCTTNVSCVV
jgi:hypothetical protein